MWGGALPYVDGYQLPVFRPTFFMPILHPMTPFFYSVHTQWPPFSAFVLNFTYKLHILACFARILRNLTILRQLLT